METHRKRLRRYEVQEQPRFITFSCYHRLPLFTNPRICDAFMDHLAEARREGGFRLLAFVIMPEHVHLVILPEVDVLPVDLLLKRLEGPFAKRVVARWRELDAGVLPSLTDARGGVHFWQAGGGYDRNIRDSAELIEKINYCHDNPRRRGLVATSVEWRWSSARWYSGEGDAGIIVDVVAL